MDSIPYFGYIPFIVIIVFMMLEMNRLRSFEKAILSGKYVRTDDEKHMVFFATEESRLLAKRALNFDLYLCTKQLKKSDRRPQDNISSEDDEILVNLDELVCIPRGELNKAPVDEIGMANEVWLHRAHNLEFINTLAISKVSTHFKKLL